MAKDDMSNLGFADLKSSKETNKSNADSSKT